LLQQMDELAPSIIIKNNGKVVAYALVMLRSCRDLIDALTPMFAVFDDIQWNGKPLNDYKYYVMGQVCVAKDYRGEGLFQLLYHKHRDVYGPDYDFIMTEVALRNTRSLRAHERTGFRTIHTYKDQLDEWAVMLWDWA